MRRLLKTLIWAGIGAVYSGWFTLGIVWIRMLRFPDNIDYVRFLDFHFWWLMGLCVVLMSIAGPFTERAWSKAQQRLDAVMETVHNDPLMHVIEGMEEATDEIFRATAVPDRCLVFSKKTLKIIKTLGDENRNNRS